MLHFFGHLDHCKTSWLGGAGLYVLFRPIFGLHATSHEGVGLQREVQISSHCHKFALSQCLAGELDVLGRSRRVVPQMQPCILRILS